VVAEVLTEQRIQLNQTEQRDLVTVLLNDMLGFGPLEPLLADEPQAATPSASAAAAAATPRYRCRTGVRVDMGPPPL
jgi:hypothetical protein